MTALSLQLRLRRGTFVLDAQFELPARGITAVFGPSGSGKTTLLRCIAGLERAQGQLSVAGEVWQDDARNIFLPPHRRPIGYVFQDARLFPHLDVQRNLHYGLTRVGSDKRPIEVDQVIEWLDLKPLLARRPEHLSGGERQRVAIGRALLAQPRLLLMDEPLAALDARRKQEILPYLERLHTQLAIPILYVSHALEEVSRLADQLVLLDQGRVEGVGPASELLTRLDLPVAHLDEAGALLETTVSEHDEPYGLNLLRFAGGELTVPGPTLSAGTRQRVRIVARDVSLALTPATDSSILNILPARVIAVADDGPAQVLVKLDVGGCALLSRITRRSHERLGLKEGAAVYAQIKGVALLPPERS